MNLKRYYKMGFKRKCKVKIPNNTNYKSMLILHKRRFFGKYCHNTLIAEANLIDKY